VLSIKLLRAILKHKHLLTFLKAPLKKLTSGKHQRCLMFPRSNRKMADRGTQHPQQYPEKEAGGRYIRDQHGPEESSGHNLPQWLGIK
jgi:hypothetical protein